MAEETGYQVDILPGWGRIAEEAHEKNPDLVWPQSIEVFDQMRREDSQVSSVHRAVTLPIRRTEWMIDPAGARDEVVEHVAANLGLPIKGREWVAPPRERDRFSWDEHLRLALLELVYGHSIFEQVYRIDAFGRAHIAKLAWRPPRSIKDFEVATDGGLVAIEQHPLNGVRKIRIPVDRLVVYVHEREGGNWIGHSLLRSAYKNWKLKDRMLRAQALTIERNGLGIPVYYGAEMPEGVPPEQHDEWAKSERESGLKIVKGLRAGETAGVSAPAKAKLELMGVTGKLPDTDGPIRYHDEQIARGLLAHFLNLGTETGSWALGSTFANFFTDSLNALAQQVEDVAQQHIVEDLVDLNWGEHEPAPRIVAAAIGSEHPATAEAVKALIECGAITPDPKLEAHMRAQYGLPVLDAQAAALGIDVKTLTTVRELAETLQKLYLAVDPVITQKEARDMIRSTGYQLDPDPEEGPDEPIPPEPGDEPDSDPGAGPDARAERGRGRHTSALRTDRFLGGVLGRFREGVRRGARPDPR
ncbi:DUF935 domain-containing protein [Leucobacter allii]|uniref:DUF935 domain-containing protein n=1 Tax=Leucobacter allii TaxID=2932247 RepID=A0ABY4FQI9_9MICO|nr:DUF935 domain-containing protein [Leucobacter allii]UOQ58564.1 DUF935 domain-containing protein [Leucobacter allii]